MTDKTPLGTPVYFPRWFCFYGEVVGTILMGWMIATQTTGLVFRLFSLILGVHCVLMMVVDYDASNKWTLKTYTGINLTVPLWVMYCYDLMFGVSAIMLPFFLADQGFNGVSQFLSLYVFGIQSLLSLFFTDFGDANVVKKKVEKKA